MHERRGFHQLTFNEQEYLHLLQVQVERAEAAADRAVRFRLSRSQQAQIHRDLEGKKRKLKEELFRILGSARPVHVDRAVMNPHPFTGEERRLSDLLRQAKCDYFEAAFCGRWNEATRYRDRIAELNDALLSVGQSAARARTRASVSLHA